MTTITQVRGTVATASFGRAMRDLLFDGFKAPQSDETGWRIPVERKEWKADEFVKGTNRFPDGYYWNVVTGGQPMVQVSLDPRFGTRIEDPRSPDAPILVIPTDWDGLVRLAVQIAYMAQAVGVRLPDGVLVKSDPIIDQN